MQNYNLFKSTSLKGFLANEPCHFCKSETKVTLKKKGEKKKSSLYSYMKPDLNKQVEQRCDSFQRKSDVSFLFSLCCFTEA